MDTSKGKLSEGLRIIWAIVVKDIVDAIKNKTTISIILGMVMVMLTGQAMPLLLKLSDVSRVILTRACSRNLRVTSPGRPARLPTNSDLRQRDISQNCWAGRFVSTLRVISSTRRPKDQVVSA